MVDINTTLTEENPTYVDGEGGGRRVLTLTEESPTYGEGEGGGRRTKTHTEETPTYVLTGDLIYAGGMVGMSPGSMQILLEP